MSCFPPLNKKSRPNSSILSPSYQSSFRATPISNTREYITEFRGGSNTPLITLRQTSYSSRKIQNSISAKKKKEILEWLADENPPAIEVLKKVTESPTPYSKLISMAIEELSYSLGPLRSEGLEELERNSSLDSAKVEVEIQQQQEKLIRVKNEGNIIREKLKIANKELSSLNTEIDQLQKLSAIHDVENKKGNSKKRKDEVFVTETPSEEPKFDDDVYKKLWMEQQQLHDVIQMLQDNLVTKQNEQVTEMRKYTRRKYPKFSNLPV